MSEGIENTEGFHRLVGIWPHGRVVENRLAEMINHAGDLVVPFHHAQVGAVGVIHFVFALGRWEPHAGNTHHPFLAHHLHAHAQGGVEAAIEAGQPAIFKFHLASHGDIHTMQESGPGKDADRFHTHRPTDAINGVAAHIEQAAAARLGLEADVGGIDGIHAESENTMNPQDRPQQPRIEESAHFGGAGMMRPHEAIHQPAAPGLAPALQFLGFSRRGTQGLFAQDRLALLDGSPGPFRV